MSLASDASDIGRLLGWASRPRDIPARHEEYHRLIVRYRDDADFARAVDAAFAGAGLYLAVDDREGAIVTAAPDSPLRVTLSDVMKRSQPAQRALVGAIILAIAHTSYPEPAMLDDPDRVAVFTTRSIVEVLDRIAQGHAEEASTDGGVEEELLESWRGWLNLVQARPNAQRRSTTDRPGVVKKICRVLVDAGYLTERSDVDGGTWLARTRFRYAVAALSEDSELYRIVNGLACAEGGTEAP